MISTNEKPKKYRIESAHRPGQPLVVVEAANESEALARCRSVALLVDIDAAAVLTAIEHHGPVSTSFFSDGYFLFIEAAQSTSH